jgi:hypothetical protein
MWEPGVNQMPKKRSFKFEKWWLSRPKFKDLVIKAWSIEKRGRSALDLFHDRTKYIRKLSKGWSANSKADIRIYEKQMMEEYHILDIMSGNQPL